MEKHSILLVGDNPWLLKFTAILIEDDDDFCVAHICTYNEALVVARHITPKIIVFSPSLSISQLRVLLLRLAVDPPVTGTIIIRSEYDFFYHGLADTFKGCGLVRQNNLYTELLPSLRKLVRDIETPNDK